MFEKRMDGFLFKAPSRRKGKKYDVYDKTDKYITSFGDISMEQYKDKIGFYSKKNHLDESRRKAFHARHGNKTDKTKAGYFSSMYLW